MSDQPCPICEGSGYVLVPVMEQYVTRDMAIDAGDPSLEGSSMRVEYEAVECRACGGRGRQVSDE
jgi:hypothetical protein